MGKKGLSKVCVVGHIHLMEAGGWKLIIWRDRGYSKLFMLHEAGIEGAEWRGGRSVRGTSSRTQRSGMNCSV